MQNNLETTAMHPATRGREAAFSEMVPLEKGESSSPRSGKRRQPKSKNCICRLGLTLQENTLPVFQLKKARKEAMAKVCYGSDYGRRKLEIS